MQVMPGVSLRAIWDATLVIIRISDDQGIFQFWSNIQLLYIGMIFNIGTFNFLIYFHEAQRLAYRYFH